MKDVFLRLKEAAEAKATATKHEAVVWQKLAEALDAFAFSQSRPIPTPVFSEAQRDKKYPQTYLTTKQAAEYLGISPQTLNAWRVRGGGPVFNKIGGLIRYKTDELEKFASQNTYPHTSAYCM